MCLHRKQKKRRRKKMVLNDSARYGKQIFDGIWRYLAVPLLSVLGVDTFNSNFFSGEPTTIIYKVLSCHIVVSLPYTCQCEHYKVNTTTFDFSHIHLLSKIIKSSSVEFSRALAAAKLILQQPSPSTILL